MGAEGGAELVPWSHPLCPAPTGAEINNLGSFSPGALLCICLFVRLSVFPNSSLCLSLALSLSLSSSFSEWSPSILRVSGGVGPHAAGRAGISWGLRGWQQLWGLCSEWLLSPALRTGQIQPTCRDSWLSLQMHPAGDGEMDTSPHRRPFHLHILFLDPWSPSIPLTSRQIPLPVI